MDFLNSSRFCDHCTEKRAAALSYKRKADSSLSQKIGENGKLREESNSAARILAAAGLRLKNVLLSYRRDANSGDFRGCDQHIGEPLQFLVFPIFVAK
ncbi:MAG TPA: hypothetical protein VHU89_10270 [Acidobacteriaceae bacterium]|jgi:hypothetical protein|nr:hypothetical protein [Acidobacteriaceae bacterium]